MRGLRHNCNINDINSRDDQHTVLSTLSLTMGPGPGMRSITDVYDVNSVMNEEQSGQR